MSSNFYLSGFGCIIGPPNAGKSTLLNALLNFPLNIVSPKPQTTRNSVLGILNNEEENLQLVFIDTPGILKKENSLLDNQMSFSIQKSMDDVDFILFMIDINDKLSRYEAFLEKIKDKPIIVLFNKVDLDETQKRKALDCSYPHLFISALNKTFITPLLKKIKPLLNDQTQYYPTDVMSNRTERFFAKEYIREALLNFLAEEIPHSCFVDIESMESTEENKMRIRAIIYCEKDSQKKILVGKNGSMIKKIGVYARPKIELLLKQPLYLELFVKVKPKWKNNSDFLKKLEYY